MQKELNQEQNTYKNNKDKIKSLEFEKYPNGCWKEQAPMFEDADKDEKKKFYYCNVYYGRGFNYALNVKSLFNSIHGGNIKYKKGYGYEILREGNPCKPYLDIEYETKKEPSKRTRERFLKKIIKDLKIIFNNKFNYPLSKEEIFFTKGSRATKDNKYKNSYHVVISTNDNHLFKYEKVNRRTTAECLAYELLKKDEKFYSGKIDNNVYSKNRQMRLIFSCKKRDDDEPLKPVNEKDEIIPQEKIKAHKFLISYYWGKDPTYIKLTNDYINYRDTKKIKYDKKINKTIKKIDESQLNDMTKRIIEIVKDYHPSAELTNITTKADRIFYNFDYSDRTETCPLTGHTHKRSNFYCYLNDEQQIILKCHSKRCCEKAKVIDYIDLEKKHYIDDSITINKKHLIDLLDENNEFDPMKFKPTQKILNGDCSNDNDKVIKLFHDWLTTDKIKTIGIKSHMGSGKTVLSKNIIEYARLCEKQFKNKLFLVHRQSLAYNICGNFYSIGFKNYLDIKKINRALNILPEKIDDINKPFMAFDPLEEGTINYKPKKQFNKISIIEVLKKVKWADYEKTDPYLKKCLDNIPMIEKVKEILKECKFDLIPNKKIEYHLEEFPNLICSIDSVQKLFENNNSLCYDLIILDEIESIINQFNSSTITNRRYTFDIVQDLLNFSKKILALDANYSNKSHLFLKSFGNIKVIDNKYVQKKKIINFTKNQDKFKNEIIKKLKDNKKIALACLSSKFACEFNNELIKKDFKTLLICADQDDRIKNGVKNINEHVKDIDILIYSPTIESGVDCNLKNHFDSLYVMLCSGSTSYKGAFQMMGRIRHFNNNIVNIFLDKTIKQLDDMPIWRYNEILEKLKFESTKFNRYKDKKTGKTKHYIDLEYKTIKTKDGTLSRIAKLGLFEKLQAYNLLESRNSNAKYFITAFKQLFNENTTFNIKDQTNKKKLNNPIEQEELKPGMIKYVNQKEMIENADIIDFEKYLYLKFRINNNEATHEEKAQKHKFDWMDKLQIKKLDINNEDETIQDLSKQLIKDFGPFKTHKIFNFQILMSKNNFTDKKIKDYMNIRQKKFINQNDKKRTIIMKARIIKDLLKNIGFSSQFDFKTEIKQQLIVDNLDNILNKSMFFKDTNFKNNLINFGMVKTYKSKIKDHKQLIKFVNSLLKNYCLKISSSSVQQRDHKTKKRTRFYKYQLNYTNNILEIIFHLKKTGKPIFDDFDILNKKDIEDIYEPLRGKAKPQQCAFD
jgi:hypothetical protein